MDEHQKRTHRLNPDEAAREHSRRASQTDSTEDQVKMLVDRLRAGQLAPERLAYAAHLGSPIARTAMPNYLQVLSELAAAKIISGKVSLNSYSPELWSQIMYERFPEATRGLPSDEGHYLISNAEIQELVNWFLVKREELNRLIGPHGSTPFLDNQENIVWPWILFWAQGHPVTFRTFDPLVDHRDDLSEREVERNQRRSTGSWALALRQIKEYYISPADRRLSVRGLSQLIRDLEAETVMKVIEILLSAPQQRYRRNADAGLREAAYRRNMDEQQRNLERDAASGDIQAEARHLTGRVRLGEIHPFRIQLAALLGDPASLSLVPSPREGFIELGSIYNYPEESIGVNDVEIVIRNIWDGQFLVSVGLGFIDHFSDRWSSFFSGQVGYREVQVLRRAIHNWTARQIELQTLTHEVYDNSINQSREEFKKSVSERLSHARQEENSAKGRVRRADQDATNALVTGSASQIRWGLINIARAIWQPGNLTNLHMSITAAGDHARRTTGNATAQREELNWQRQYLIARLLDR